MTITLGALEKTIFDGNTILLKISEENDKHRYVYIGGDMICSFLTNDNIYKYISNVRNYLTPYRLTRGEENTYFLTPQFKIIKNDKINDSELLSTNESTVDPFDYHVSNCGNTPLKKYEYKKFIQNMIES